MDRSHGNIEIEDTVMADEEIEDIKILKNRPSSQIMVQIEDKQVRATLDSGASCSLMTLKLWKEISKEVTRPRLFSAKNVILIDYSGKKKCPVLGKTTITVQIQTLKINVEVYVVKDANTALLLGLDFLGNTKSILQFDVHKVEMKTEDEKIIIDMLPYSSPDVETSKEEEIHTENHSNFVTSSYSQPPSEDDCTNEDNIPVVKHFVREIMLEQSHSELSFPEILRHNEKEENEEVEENEKEEEEEETLLKQPYWDGYQDYLNREKEKEVILSGNIGTESGVQTKDVSSIQEEANDNQFQVTTEELYEVSRQLEHLTTSEQEQLFRLLCEFQDIFSKKPGKCNKFQYSLKVQSNQPMVRRPYPIPKMYIPEVRRQLQLLEQWKILEKCQSVHLNPLVVTVKKGGDLRICVDFRLVNQFVPLEQVRTDTVDNLLSQFSKSKYFSNLDFTQGFLQIPLTEESRDYTAFYFDGILYRFLRLPFGILNGPSAFTQCMNIVIGDDLKQHVTAYIDDIMVHNPDFSSHIIHLRTVLQRIKEAGMTLNLKKSSFCQQQTEYLGHIISEKGITQKPSRIECIQNLPTPTTLKTLRRCLGIFSWHRKFIENFAGIAAPLYDLLVKNKKWKWEQEHENAFQTLKQKVVENVQLTHPNWNYPFNLQTDGSLTAIAAILWQDIEGERKVIAYASRKLKSSEKSYSITEIECLSVLFGVKRFSTYLIGKKFTIISDHKALTWLYKAKEWNPRLHRWSLYLQEFSYQIQHCSGKENTAADALSRIPEGEEVLKLQVNSIPEVTSSLLNLPKETWLKMYAEDEKLHAIIQELKSANGTTQRRTTLKYYQLTEDILVQRDFHNNKYWRICVPKGLISLIITTYHTHFGHPGFRRTFNNIFRRFTWNSMQTDIRSFIKHCIRCQELKPQLHPTRTTITHVQASHLRELIACDILGPYPRGKDGSSFIFTVMDVYSKYLVAYKMRSAKTRSIIRCLKMYFMHHGIPTAILSDNGPQFRCSEYREFVASYNITAKYTSVYHPASNPIERKHRDLVHLFRCFCNEDHTLWSTILEDLVYILNNTYSEGVDNIPAELFLNTKANKCIFQYLGLNDLLPSDDSWPQRRILTEPTSPARSKRKIKTQIQQNDLVFVRTHYKSEKPKKKILKFFNLYYGPCLVTRVLGNNTYVLVDCHTGKTLELQNTDNLKLWNVSDNIKEKWIQASEISATKNNENQKQ